MAGLRKNPHYCKNNKVIPLDKQFSGVFNVDWCRFAVARALYYPAVHSYMLTTIRDDVQAN